MSPAQHSLETAVSSHPRPIPHSPGQLSFMATQGATRVDDDDDDDDDDDNDAVVAAADDDSSLLFSE